MNYVKMTKCLVPSLSYIAPLFWDGTQLNVYQDSTGHMLWPPADADWTINWQKPMSPVMPCSLHQTHEGSHTTFVSGH